jgi:hypothetical protein
MSKIIAYKFIHVYVCVPWLSINFYRENTNIVTCINKTSPVPDLLLVYITNVCPFNSENICVDFCMQICTNQGHNNKKIKLKFQILKFSICLQIFLFIRKDMLPGARNPYPSRIMCKNVESYTLVLIINSMFNISMIYP